MDAAAPLLSAIPAKLLKAAYLVGKVPFRAYQGDQRVSYTLYIPPDPYCEVHTALQQGKPTQRLKLVVNIHGTRRDASLCRDSLIEFANTHRVAILSPLFPAGLDGPLDLNSYKVLRSKTLQADLALLGILKEVSHICPGLEVDKFYMMGFSGGAQFVHRFMYLYPERLRAVVIAAPGGTTQLDEQLPWPAGIGNVEQVFSGRKVDLKAVRDSIELQMVVGGEDNSVDDLQQLHKLFAKLSAGKSQKSDDLFEGTERRLGRLEAMKDLHDVWLAHGFNCELTIVSSVGHDYQALLPTMTSCMVKMLS